jgi:hypothetical protein
MIGPSTRVLQAAPQTGVSGRGRGCKLRCSRSLVRALLIGAVSFFGAPAWPETSSTPARTAESVKAEYFFLVSRLTGRPGMPAAAMEGVVELCVIGGDVELFEALQSFEGQLVRGGRLQARHYHRTSFLDDCEAVFISRSERAILPRVMAYFATRPVLTVSDIHGFVELGGMIELIQEDSRIRFLANPWCAEQVGLKIDPRLLELADNVAQLDEGECP